MMDESDDDFKELCASFFRRVKKNGTKEVSGERETQKASNSTQIRSKLKKTKQPATKSKTLHGAVEKKPQSGSQAPRTKKQEATKLQESEPALPVNGEGGVPAPAPDQPVPWERAHSIQTESAPSRDSQPLPSCLSTTVPRPSKPRAAELVLQRMQQFKRADPERLRHASEECSLKAALEENVPKNPQEEMVAGDGYEPEFPAKDSDTAVALALQQEFGGEGEVALDNNLEERGLFFCQMCQKNLSAMNVTRREQHVNRCLDEAEKVSRPSAPQIPECPICGKLFLTSKSRISHLKQCAVKMEVGPQLLLQAVRLQTAQPEGGGDPPAPSFSNHAGRVKRKRATNKEPQKRRKIKSEPPSEDLLVAMALSRSEMEQGLAMPTLRLESAFSEKRRPGAEKRSRRKKPIMSPPQLLVQDSEITGRQIEDRMAQLLSEEVELSSTPPLLASRIFKAELEEAGWHLPPPEGKQNFLWEGSALTRAWPVESFYTAGLVPPIVPKRPTKFFQEPELPLLLPEQPEPGVRRPPAVHSSPPAGRGPRDSSLSASQREHQALQTLVDLAEEGLSPSPWPCSSGRPAGLYLVPSSLPLTGFVLPPNEKPHEKGGHASLSLGLLVADFSTMVNNPHLSDVQFQTDSGEVLYAHKFVLYARCPLLIQYVNNEGFSAVEDGELTQRVLLSNVSAEATHAFLRYLYTAATDLPPHLAPDLRSLALRFGVSVLVHLCEQVPMVTDLEGNQQEEKEDENCDSRAENFQELLRSMWVSEEEAAETLWRSESHDEDRERVNDAEMEEIYEFAATQRRLLQEERAPDTDEDTDQPGEDSPAAGPALAASQSKEQLERAEQVEVSGLRKTETPTSWENPRRSLLFQGRHSDRAGEAKTQEQEAPKEAAGHPSPGSPGRDCQAGRKEGSLLHPVKVQVHEQLLASTQGQFSQVSQVTSHDEEQSGSFRARWMEVAHAPALQPASPPHLSCLRSQPPSGRSPSRSRPHLHHTSSLSPSASSHSGAFKVASSILCSPAGPPKHRRDSSAATLLKEPGHWKGRRCSSMLERKNKGALNSPEKSPPIDLTQIKPEHLSPPSQAPPSLVNKDDEVILLLDSDEELELQQTRTKLVFNESSGEKNILEVSPKSSELFSVIDVDADQDRSRSPLRTEVTLQQEDREGQSGDQVAVGSRGTPWLPCGRESSSDEDGSTDTSWLVPATPRASRSQDCSSQTQITGLRTRPTAAAAELARHTPRAAQEASKKVPVSAPGPSTSGQQACTRRHSLSSPSAPQLISGGAPDFTRRFQKLWPPGPCLLNEAAVNDVVEVGDSDDEQEVASHKVNSSPLLDGDPPITVDDCCWHSEPLSPIPIDHMNLERTGPLSTSSPRRQAWQAQDGSDCRSPGLLGTTPIRGSYAASSPGSSRLSFLNPALWDDWDGEEQRHPEAPAAQTPGARAQKPEEPEMPKAANQKNLPPKVPITPMPRYSIMETPVLKRELDRFGVRPLPKCQMVLKLKEIFQYTHQTLDFDSEEDIQSSQVPPEGHGSQTLAKTYKPSRAGAYTQLEATAGPGTHRSERPTKMKGSRHCKQQPSESIPHLSGSTAREPHPGPDGDAQFPASQESMVASVDGSDSSFSSQSSSSCEFGVAFESAGEDEESGQGVSASQVTPTADAEEAVTHYIRSKPALYRKVLMYQPLELAELQAELKQDGIRVPAGRLLDILDAHCITFTTATARKEKLKQKGRHHVGRRKREERLTGPHTHPTGQL